MIEFHDDGVIPTTRDVLWRLLQAHQEDGTIGSIHPLVIQQTTVERSSTGSIVDRIIDVRGRRMRSRWKLSYRPPEFSRWEILDSEGPWSTGSYLENTYAEATGGTRIVTHGSLHVKVLPFFLPQGLVIRRVFRDIDAEDLAFLPKLPPP